VARHDDLVEAVRIGAALARAEAANVVSGVAAVICPVANRQRLAATKLIVGLDKELVAASVAASSRWSAGTSAEVMTCVLRSRSPSYDPK